MDYINDLMRNYPLDSDSIEMYPDFFDMDGGAEYPPETVKSRPTGGFPPIYPCDKEKPKEIKAKGANYKSTVNIKEIMKQRKENKPFFDI